MPTEVYTHTHTQSYTESMGTLVHSPINSGKTFGFQRGPYYSWKYPAVAVPCDLGKSFFLLKKFSKVSLHPSYRPHW